MDLCEASDRVMWRGGKAIGGSHVASLSNNEKDSNGGL